jgi:hypothetical protein
VTLETVAQQETQTLLAMKSMVAVTRQKFWLLADVLPPRQSLQ